MSGAADGVLEYTKSDKDDHQLVVLKGMINEEAELNFFKELPETGKVVINSKDVDRINSCGVREWIQALKTAPESTEIIYEECSPAFMDQVNMITNFVGNGTIKSLYLPFVCPSCDAKKEELCDLEDNMTDEGLELPELMCSECNEEMELGDDPDQLFSFIS